MKLLTNSALIAAIIGWVMAELIKIIIKVCRTGSFKEVSFMDMFASGGMPSSHSSSMAALTAACAWVYGFGSSEFAISAVVTMIVMYDASGVRHETGKQAKALNMIMRDMFSGDPEYANTAFKELIGHTKLQVTMGAVLGIIIGVLYPLIIGIPPAAAF